MHGDSRRHGAEIVKHEKKEKNIAAVHTWYRNTHTINTGNLKQCIQRAQELDEKTMLQWEEPYSLTREQGTWVMRGHVVIPEDAALCREILKLTHDHSTAGHPGAKKTLLLTARNYWWPKMADFMTQYVKGCRVCQATKPALVCPKPPQYPITTESLALPFSTIALDLIIDLPPSQGYDSILTITDHDVTKAALFFPCHQTITGEGVSTIYAQHVFPHYRLPWKVISDRDTRFTSRFIKELEKILDITPNMSTMYHP